MAAASTDKVRNAAPNFATTLANSMLVSDTTMTLQSVTGLPTATGITLVIDATDPVSGNSTPNLKEVVTGVVSGSTVTTLSRGLDGTTAQAHASGANVVMWITANLWNDWQTSYLVGHTQAGAHNMTSPQVTTGIFDTNNKEVVGFTATANAVNYINAANSATGNDVVLSAAGTDTNIGIDINPKGTGAIKAGGLINANAGLTVPSGQALSFPNGNYTISRNNNGSNVTEGTAKIQSGWVAIAGAANPTLSTTVTFPVAYTNVPIVVAVYGGDTSGSTSTLGSGGINVKQAYADATSLTTTNFLAYAATRDGTNWSVGNTVYIQWIAIGI